MRMSDTQFQRLYGALSLISVVVLAALMLSGSEFLVALRYAGGFLALTGFAPFGFGLWTRRYRADEKTNG